MTTPSRTAKTSMPAAVQDGHHLPDITFDERRTDRLVIRRFRAGDASSFAAYRSDPAVAGYQSWDTPFPSAQAQVSIDSFGTTNPDTPGGVVPVRPRRGRICDHIGDVAAGVDTHDPRLATIGATLAASAQGRGYAGEALAWPLDYLFSERTKHRVTADCDVRNHKIARSSNASKCDVRPTIGRAPGGRTSGSTNTSTPSSLTSGAAAGRPTEAPGTSILGRQPR